MSSISRESNSVNWNSNFRAASTRGRSVILREEGNGGVVSTGSTAL